MNNEEKEKETFKTLGNLLYEKAMELDRAIKSKK